MWVAAVCASPLERPNCCRSSSNACPKYAATATAAPCPACVAVTATHTRICTQVLSQLPCRKGASFQPAVCVDVRSRTGLPEQTIGNFVFWALPDTVDAAKQSLGQLALSVRGAIQRCGRLRGWGAGASLCSGRCHMLCMPPCRAWASWHCIFSVGEAI